MAPKWPQNGSKYPRNPTRALPLDPIGGGGGGGGGLTAPPQTPQLLVTSYARLQRATRVEYIMPTLFSCFFIS